MTADELATLAKVERAGDKLADAIHGLDSYAALGGAPMERTHRAEAAVTEWREALALLRGLLAEPQVNPSEAKSLNRIGKLADWIIRDRREFDKVTAYAGEIKMLARRSG